MPGWLSKLLRRRLPVQISVSWDETGLRRVRQQGDELTETRCTWEDVMQVYAYKRDLGTVDEVRLCFMCRAGADNVDLAEDEVKLVDLAYELPQRLPGCLKFEDWWFEVTSQAFEMKLTLLFDRSKQ